MIQALLISNWLPAPPITVAFEVTAGSPMTVDGAAAGQPGKIAVALGSPDSVVFAPGYLGGTVTTVDVRIGDFRVASTSVGPPANMIETYAYKGGLKALLGYGSFKGCQIGFDIKAGTLTLWRGAATETVKAWAGRGGTATSIPFESRVETPIVMSLLVGKQPAKVLLTTATYTPMFPDPLFSNLSPSKASLEANGSRLIHFAFPGGPTPGWSWSTLEPAEGEGRLVAQNLDGRLDVRWLGVERIVIDTETKTLWFSAPSDKQRFATWLALTTHLPVAVLNGRFVYNHSLSLEETLKPMAGDPPYQADILLRKIDGVNVTDLFAAFEKDDAASSELLAGMAARTTGRSFDVILGEDDDHITGITFDPP